MSDFNTPEFAASQYAFAKRMAEERAGKNYLRKLQDVVDNASTQLDDQQDTINRLQQENRALTAQLNMAQMLLAVNRDTLDEVVTTGVAEEIKVKNVFARKFAETKARSLQLKTLYETDFHDMTVLSRFSKTLQFVSKMLKK